MIHDNMINFVLKNKTLLFICLVALLLRLPLLNGSLWMDEAAQALESSRPFAEQTQIQEDYQPPLFHLLVHFFTLVSKEEWWLRLPSLAAGIGTIAILYLVLEEKYGRNVAIAGSVLLSTSPFHIFFSQELRPYSLATFFAILSWYTLISTRFAKRQWIWYTVSTTLGLYTMYLIPFNILAQLIYVFFENRKNLKSVICSLMAVALLFLPWVPSFIGQLRFGTQLTTQLPGWAAAVATPQLKVLPLTLGKFIVGQVPFHGHLILLGITAAILSGVLYLVICNGTHKKTRIFFYWFVLPLILSWLVSFVVPVIQPKRVMFILPALYGLIAWVTTKKQYVLYFICLFQLFCFGLYLRDTSMQRENWRSLIQTIESDGVTERASLFSFQEPFAPWRWYTTGAVRTITTGHIRIDADSDLASVTSQLDTVSRVYLFEYLRDLTDPHHVLETTLANKGFRETGRIDAQAIGFVRIFARMN